MMRDKNPRTMSNKELKKVLQDRGVYLPPEPSADASPTEIEDWREMAIKRLNKLQWRKKRNIPPTHH